MLFFDSQRGPFPPTTATFRGDAFAKILAELEEGSVTKERSILLKVEDAIKRGEAAFERSIALLRRVVKEHGFKWSFVVPDEIGVNGRGMYRLILESNETGNIHEFNLTIPLRSSTPQETQFSSDEELAIADYAKRVVLGMDREITTRYLDNADKDLLQVKTEIQTIRSRTFISIPKKYLGPLHPDSLREMKDKIEGVIKYVRDVFGRLDDLAKSISKVIHNFFGKKVMNESFNPNRLNRAISAISVSGGSCEFLESADLNEGFIEEVERYSKIWRTIYKDGLGLVGSFQRYLARIFNTTDAKISEGEDLIVFLEDFKRDYQKTGGIASGEDKVIHEVHSRLQTLLKKVNASKHIKSLKNILRKFYDFLNEILEDTKTFLGDVNAVVLLIEKASVNAYEKTKETFKEVKRQVEDAKEVIDSLNKLFHTLSNI